MYFLVNGGWSRWQSDHHSCSATCGRGVKLFYRSCNHPRPDHGGQMCQGPSTKREKCETKPCPGNNFHKFICYIIPHLKLFT